MANYIFFNFNSLLFIFLSLFCIIILKYTQKKKCCCNVLSGQQSSSVQRLMFCSCNYSMQFYQVSKNGPKLWCFFVYTDSLTTWTQYNHHRFTSHSPHIWCNLSVNLPHTKKTHFCLFVFFNTFTSYASLVFSAQIHFKASPWIPCWGCTSA